VNGYSASVGFSISSSTTYTEASVDRRAHAVTFSGGVSLGVNTVKSNSLTVGYAYYDLLAETP
jgi:hypothetical protein